MWFFLFYFILVYSIYLIHFISRSMIPRLPYYFLAYSYSVLLTTIYLPCLTCPLPPSTSPQLDYPSFTSTTSSLPPLGNQLVSPLMPCHAACIPLWPGCPHFPDSLRLHSSFYSPIAHPPTPLLSLPCCLVLHIPIPLLRLPCSALLYLLGNETLTSP